MCALRWACTFASKYARAFIAVVAVGVVMHLTHFKTITPLIYTLLSHTHTVVIVCVIINFHFHFPCHIRWSSALNYAVYCWILNHSLTPIFGMQIYTLHTFRCLPLFIAFFCVFRLQNWNKYSRCALCIDYLTILCNKVNCIRLLAAADLEIKLTFTAEVLKQKRKM